MERLSEIRIRENWSRQERMFKSVKSYLAFIRPAKLIMFACEFIQWGGYLGESLDETTVLIT